MTFHQSPVIHSLPGECACGAPCCEQCGDKYWKVIPGEDRPPTPPEPTGLSFAFKLDMVWLLCTALACLGGLWMLPMALFGAVAIYHWGKQ